MSGLSSVFFSAQIVAQVWPFLGQYMEKLLAETVAPAVRGANPHLQTFTFTRVELGEKVRWEEMDQGLGRRQGLSCSFPPASSETTSL